ncbi:hypothetical protein CHARACLAT_019221, partial [Characodon lateralis]|nr:hypothetical protein [Characodon lateralis]
FPHLDEQLIMSPTREKPSYKSNCPSIPCRRIYTSSVLTGSRCLQQCRSGTRMTPTTSTCLTLEGSTLPWPWKMSRQQEASLGTRCWTFMRYIAV